MSDIPDKPAYIGPKLGGSNFYTPDEENRPIREPDIVKWGQWSRITSSKTHLLIRVWLVRERKHHGVMDDSLCLVIRRCAGD